MLEDSPGYQRIIAIGEAQGREAGKETTLRRKIVLLVQHRLDDVPEALSQRLEALDAQQLDLLFDRVLEALDATEVKAALELDKL